MSGTVAAFVLTPGCPSKSATVVLRALAICVRIAREGLGSSPFSSCQRYPLEIPAVSAKLGSVSPLS